MLLVKLFLLRFQTFFRSLATHTGSPKSLVWKRRRFNLAVFPGNCKLATSRMSCPFTSDTATNFPSQSRSRRRLGNLTRLLSGRSLVNTKSALFERFLRSSLAQGCCVKRRRSSAGKCRLDEPGSIFLGLSSLRLAREPSAALQQVSHAECLESLTYKNRAVNPSKQDYFY